MTADITPKPEAEYFGVAVSHMGDGGEWMITLGHPGKRKALAVFNRHARAFVGLVNLADDRSASAAEWLEDVRETWAVFREPDPERGDSPEFDWYADWADETTPGAKPITLIEVA